MKVTENITNKDFMNDVYDNLMKNTMYNPLDFSEIDDECFIDCDKNEIHIGKFILIVKTGD